MLKKKTMLAIACLGALFCSCTNEKSTPKEEFKYLVDEFADLKIIRYQIPGWENLTFSQKEYIYHLSEAAKAGRDIIWDQNCEANLKVRKVLEQIIENYKGDKESQDYKDFIVYAKRVFFSNGIHHHYAEEKFFPKCSQDFFASLMKDAGLDKQTKEILPIIYDKNIYATKKYQGTEKDLLEASSVNFYENVTRKEATNFYNKMRDPKDNTPISYGLNSKLVKKNGKIYEDVYKIDGLYGAAISKIVEHLEAAKKCTENDIQKDYITKLISYYKTGDLNTWDEYNIAWVKDTKSDVDFVNGFIEDYSDPLGMKATWESIVNFRNIEASKRTEIISTNAQWFEDHSPVNKEFKKKEVKGVSAKVITITCLGGDCHPTSPLGINLPNADWIRKDHGSKSVTIENIALAYDYASQESPKSLLAEFAWDEKEIELVKKYGSLTNNLHTDLHECLGHGSGQLLPGVSASALAEFSSTLEEARADLFALYYLADNKLVELGIIPNNEAYKAEYSNYIRNGIQTQLTRIELGKSVTQAHMQNRKLIAEWCFEKGAKNNVIEKKVKNGKTYFVVNDYPALRTLFGELLVEIQRIKSTGDYEAGKALVEKYSINIDYDFHKEILERYASLNLKPYGGFINPDITPVEKDGKVTDYKVEYGTDFLKQMLEYGKKYSTL